MSRCRLAHPLLILFFALLPAMAAADEFPGASGMAPLNERAYLCVQDAKDKPGSEKERFGSLIVFTEEEREQFGSQLGMLAYTPLSWYYGECVPAGEPWPSDLEAICSVPGCPGEFLACESGYWEGNYGRLFRLHADAGENETWGIVIDEVLHLPELADQVEGIACAADSTGRLLLILSERGGSGPGIPGWVHWGWLDEFEAGQPCDDASLQWDYSSLAVGNPFNAAYPQARAVSDLYLDGQGTLWTASACDPDADHGPFVSCIWPVANVVPGNETPVTAAVVAEESWLLEGLKVEALSGPCTPGALLSIATDDEGFGGIWRPLGVPTDMLQDDADAAETDIESGE